MTIQFQSPCASLAKGEGDFFLDASFSAKIKFLEALPEWKKYAKIGSTNLKSMKLIVRSIYTLAILGGLALWSCSPSKKGGGGEETASDTIPDPGIKGEIARLISEMPSPHQIPYLLQATGAEFNQSLLNNRKKVDSYLTRNDKAALNLGVYVADVGYLSSYDKTQDAIDYLGAAKTLADNLGIINTFDPEMLSKFESNIANKDSLATLIEKTARKADKYLLDDDRNKLVAMLITGGFVEGLYISTGLIKSYPKDLLPDDQRNLILTPLMLVILKQETTVNKLLELLNLVDKSEPVAEIITNLSSLKASYQALNINEKIKNNKANLALSDKHLEEITKIVDKMRTSITE